MIFEISFSANNGADSYATKRAFASMDQALSYAKVFMSDWWLGAWCGIFCIDTKQYLEISGPDGPRFGIR
jgi:hypothetical protein